MSSIAPTMDASRPQTQMYQQQPMMASQMMYQQPVTINKVVSSKAWHNTKIALGSLILTIDIILFGLGGGALATVFGIIDMVIVYPLAGVGLVWQIAEFITLCVHPDRGIHPGAHVGMQLVLWLGSALCAGSLTTFVAYHQSYSSYYRGYSSSSRYRQSLGDFVLWQRFETAMTAFLYILFVLHFTLFVRACIECHRRNTMKPTVMIAAPPPQPYYPTNGMQQMPPQQALYPAQYNPHMSMMSQPQPQHNPHMSIAPVPAPQQTARDTSASFGYYAPEGHHNTTGHGHGEHKSDVPHTGSPAPVSTVSGEHAPHNAPEVVPQGHQTRNVENV